MSRRTPVPKEDDKQYESDIEIVFEDNSRPFFAEGKPNKVTTATVKSHNTSKPRDVLEAAAAGDQSDEDGLFNEELLNVHSSEPDFLRGLQDLEPELLRRKLTVLQTFGDGPIYNTG